MGAANTFYLLISDAHDAQSNPPGFEPQHWNTFRSDNRFYDTIFVRVLSRMMMHATI